MINKDCLSYRTVEWLDEQFIDRGKSLSSTIFTNLNSTLAAIPHPYTKDGKKLTLDFSTVLNLNNTDIADLWIDRYDEYLVYKPINDSNADRIAAKLNKKALTTIKLNGPKYQAMLYTLAANYNPIENYSMVERGIDAEIESKVTDSLSHEGSEANTESGTGTIVNTTWTSDIPYDREAGLEGGNLSTDGNATFGGSQSPAVTPLTSKTISQQGPSSGYGKTNTLSYNDRKDVREITHDSDSTTNLTVDGNSLTGDRVSDHVFTRSGNVGVTTSQQMLESEIQLKREAVLKEFFKDFNDLVLLSVLEASQVFSIDTTGFVGDWVTHSELSAALARVNNEISRLDKRIDAIGGGEASLEPRVKALETDVDGLNVEVETLGNEVSNALLEIEQRTGYGTQLPNGTNLNDVRELGSYYVQSGSRNIINIPINSAFRMFVYPANQANNTRLFQKFIPYWGTSATRLGTFYIRCYRGETDGWSEWYKFTDSGSIEAKIPQIGYTDYTFLASDNWNKINDYVSRAFKSISVPESSVISAQIISTIGRQGLLSTTINDGSLLLESNNPTPISSSGSIKVRLWYLVQNNAIQSNKLVDLNADLSSLIADFSDNVDSERLDLMATDYIEDLSSSI